MAIEFRFRRNIASEWLKHDPVLGPGEPGFEMDTGRMKIGNGVRQWSNLEYYVPGVPAPAEHNHVDLATRAELVDHEESDLPHPVYDDGPSLKILYDNAKA